MTKRKILSTGVAGFIGSHTAKALLERGYAVTGLDNFDPFYDRRIKESNLKNLISHTDFTFHECDLRNYHHLIDILQNDIPDVVLHLAAKAGVLKSISDTETYIQNNIAGTHNILEWMRLHQVKKLVFASSSSVYGNHNEIPFKETANTDFPLTPYATTKKTCELLNYNYHYIHNFDIVNLRFFTVYGPGQRPDLAIHKFTKLIWNKEVVKIYGAGDTARDYTYIDDIVDGIIKSIEYVSQHTPIYETFNLGNHNPVKLLTLVQLLYKTMNMPVNYEHTEEQLGDMRITCADIQKAQSVLGYHPGTSIEEGIQKFISWYQSEQIK